MPGNAQILYFIYKVVYHIESVTYLIYSARRLRRQGLARIIKLITGLVTIGLGLSNLSISPLSMILLVVGFVLADQGLVNLIPMHRYSVYAIVILVNTAILSFYGRIPGKLGGVPR